MSTTIYNTTSAAQYLPSLSHEIGFWYAYPVCAVPSPHVDHGDGIPNVSPLFPPLGPVHLPNTTRRGANITTIGTLQSELELTATLDLIANAA